MERRAAEVEKALSGMRIDEKLASERADVAHVNGGDGRSAEESGKESAENESGLTFFVNVNQG